jgi:transcription initiation factor TFIIIB Brf1 subunit/transcription initiation factor TFIIB
MIAATPGASNKHSNLSDMHSRMPGFQQDAKIQKDLETIKELCQQLGLPDRIVELCEELLNKIKKPEQSPASPRVQSAGGLLPALVYVACRQSGVSRTLKEIADACQRSGCRGGAGGRGKQGKKLTKKMIGRCYMSLSSQMDLRLAPTSATQFVPRFAGLMQMSMSESNAATEVVRRSEEKGLVAGRNPSSVAAAAIHFVSSIAAEARGQQCAITFTQIAESCVVAETSVKEIYRSVLLPSKEQLVPEWFQAECSELDSNLNKPATSSWDSRRLQKVGSESSVTKTNSTDVRASSSTTTTSSSSSSSGRSSVHAQVNVKAPVRAERLLTEEEERENARAMEDMEEAINAAIDDLTDSDSESDSDSDSDEEDEARAGSKHLLSLEETAARVSPLPSPQPSTTVTPTQPSAQPETKNKKAVQRRPRQRKTNVNVDMKGGDRGGSASASASGSGRPSKISIVPSVMQHYVAPDAHTGLTPSVAKMMTSSSSE